MSELAKALVAAQAELKNAPLNKTNPHFKSKFADLTSVRDSTLPVLNKHGLGITQFTRFDGTNLVLVTQLLHTSGETLEGEWPLPVDKPQAMGSALTYARRYNWQSICGITADEDDDGNQAQSSESGRHGVQGEPGTDNSPSSQGAAQPSHETPARSEDHTDGSGEVRQTEGSVSSSPEPVKLSAAGVAKRTQFKQLCKKLKVDPETYAQGFLHKDLKDCTEADFDSLIADASKDGAA